MNHALVLTHGAGSNCETPLLRAIDAALSARGLLVIRYDLYFRGQRRGGPPSPGTAEKDRESIREAIAGARRQVTGRVLAGGHSYGGRQTSMVAAEDPSLVDGLLLLSYPLHPPGRPEQLRVAHFAALRTPALFVHGDRDDFGTVEEMRRHIPSGSELMVVPGAGHALAGKNAGPVAERIADAVQRVLGA